MAVKIFGIVTFLLFAVNCSTTEPPPPPDGDNPELTIVLEDVSCTEAWIKLTTTDLQLPTSITLKQNDTANDTINLSSPDTLLYIDSLLPNTNYLYQASSSEYQALSNEANVTTMDTTSHDFTFETFTFGGTAGSSTLYDVAIISEGNIWAVGEIYVADTSQNGYTMYNAVHWDGNEWELKRIYYYGNCSAVQYPPLKSIWAFSDTDIVITNGGSIGWFDGNTINLDCGVNPLLTGAINKIWGTSSNDLYIVGNNGNIARYDGIRWTRIESGTKQNIGDIWGIDDATGSYNKYLAAVDAMLILNESNELHRISTEQGHTLSSVWGCTDKLIYTAGGNGLSLYKNYNWEKINSPYINTIYCIRGQGHNNVFGLSSALSLLHFNGNSWQFINSGKNNIYYRQDVINNVAVAVGWQGDKALLTILTRSN